MVKIIDVGQTMRALGLYRVAKDYVIKERVNVNPYNLHAILSCISSGPASLDTPWYPTHKPSISRVRRITIHAGFSLHLQLAHDRESVHLLQ